MVNVKNATLAFSLLFSAGAFSTCPPTMPCSRDVNASTISGSNADTALQEFRTHISQSSNEVAQAITDMANAHTAALSQGGQSVIAASAELSQIRLNQELKLQQAMLDKEMAHKSHIAEETYRSRTTVVSMDDTKEEFDVILEYLDEFSDLSVPEIVYILTETIDNDPEGKVMVPLKISEGICSEEQIKEDGLCSIPKKIIPGAKLQAMFRQCSIDKRLLVEREKERNAQVAAIEMSNKRTAKALETTNTAGSIIARSEKQRALSCSPTDFRNGLCANTLSPEEYQEAIVIGDIIPNGAYSASNFTRPSNSSAEGFISDLDEATREEVRKQMLNRIPLQEYPNQKVVPIQFTYRNANQVKAALDFIDNVVAEDLVPALDPSARRYIHNAEYQSRHLSRVASLNLARLALNESMSMRLGKNMRAMMESGEFENTNKFNISADSPDNKESVLGAGVLDVLASRVQQSSADIQLTSMAGDSTSVGSDLITSPSSNDATSKILESMMLQNELLFKELLIGEQLLSMQAVSLAQKANSQKMIRMMSDLRRGQ